MVDLKKLLAFGIIVIDKPSGPTSFSVSDFVRESLGLNKTSHFGTLDPKVTGVLPIALGRACRLTGYFLGHDKVYMGIIRVHEEVSVEKLQKVINENFLGKIKQTPPKRSSVKRAEREREIKKFKILEKNEKDFLFISEVQGGTYIRKLCSDLGDLIGGAHMLELRRTKASIFDEEQAVTLYDLEKAVEEYKKGNEKSLAKMIIPAEDAIKKVMECVEADKESLGTLLTGKPLLEGNLKEIPKEDVFAVFLGKRFIEVAEKSYDNFFARPKFVLN